MSGEEDILFNAGQNIQEEQKREREQEAERGGRYVSRAKYEEKYTENEENDSDSENEMEKEEEGKIEEYEEVEEVEEERGENMESVFADRERTQGESAKFGICPSSDKMKCNNYRVFLSINKDMKHIMGEEKDEVLEKLYIDLSNDIIPYFESINSKALWLGYYCITNDKINDTRLKLVNDKFTEHEIAPNDVYRYAYFIENIIIPKRNG
jgi:hypothetical protein